MFFSIIVPIYNVEKYLKECIDSVISQTFTDFELILVDDGSPDNCPKICDDYAKKDSRVKVIHKTNGGLSDARNAGIEIAKGEYLLFLDGDDSLKHNDVLSALNEDVTNKNYPDVMIFNDKGFYDGVTALKGDDFLENVVQIWNEKRIYDVVVWNKIFKRNYIVEKGLFFIKGYVHEDDYWTPIAIYNASNCALMTVDICNHRLNETSITRTKNEKSLFNRIVSKINLSKKAIEYFDGVKCCPSLKKEVLEIYAALFLGAIVNYFKLQDKKLKKAVVSQLKKNKKMFLSLKESKIKKYKLISLTYRILGVRGVLFLIKLKFNSVNL